MTTIGYASVNTDGQTLDAQQAALHAAQLALQRSLDASVNARGVELTVLEIAFPDDLHAAFQRLAREGVKVAMMLQDFMFLNERKRVALFAMAERLPTMSSFRENVEDSGLMSCGTNVRESWRRTGSFVDKILKGAKPGDLPIEFPTKLELLINLTAAKALEMTIPSTLLCSCRRGDRITTFFAAAQNVCFWHKADITRVLLHVRFQG